MSSSAITTQVAQLKIGNVQNQADTSAVYSAGVWSFKNSAALTSVTITDAGDTRIGTTSSLGAADRLTVVGGNVAVQRTAGIITAIGDNTQQGYAGTLSNHPFLFYSNATERMRIDAGGALSFQTATQSSSKAFFIKNNGETGNGRCSVTLDSGNTNNSSCKLSFEKNSGNLWNIFNDISANNGTDFAIWSSSSGGVTLSSNTATSWSPRSSDERKKKNFETTQGLSEVLQIEPVKYHFNSEEDSATKRLGFKAQNLQAVIPEMVHPTGEKAEDGSDYLTITPDYILPVLVKAIQELSAKNEALEARLAALESK